MKSVLAQAAKICTPTKDEQIKIERIVKEVQQKVNSALKKLKLKARCIVGGSVAKGTWLPNISDVDFFILFDYERYRGRHQVISDMAEIVLLDSFKFIQRLRGSRDYFNVTYKNFILEFVPVLEISELSEALNLTDYSPLHIYWVRDRINTNKKLQTEVRLAKQFFKANGVYGAESYIGGFSGHATEILTIYYGGFLQLLKNAVEWKHGDVIDVNHTYRDPNQVFDKINEAKLQSPIIVIDPVEPTRNAAAALGEEKFKLLKKTAKKFLAQPALEFFKIKPFDVKQLKQKKSQKLFILRANPTKGKEDIIGSRFAKRFLEFQKELERNDFKILKAGWHWPGEGKATFWVYLPARQLSKERVIEGPPKNVPEVFRKKFKRKWKKVFLRGSRYYARAERKYRESGKLVSKLAKAHKFRLLRKLSRAQLRTAK